MSLYRLRTDFQFAIVTSFGGVAILGILPFAIYRFATGQLLAGSVDLAIVACIAAGVVLAWRGNRGALRVAAVHPAGPLAVVELVARELHRQSGRGGPFVAINAAVLSIVVDSRKARLFLSLP